MPEDSGPEEHPLESVWVWRAHLRENGGSRGSWGNYTKGYFELAHSHSIESFWNVFNSLPCVSRFARNVVSCGKAPLTGFSLFRQGVLPEWEDETNAMGGEVCVRACMLPLACRDFWMSLLLEAIGGGTDCIVGARFVHKGSHSKLEVWYAGGTSQEEVDALSAWVGAEARRLGGSALPPTLVRHCETLSRVGVAKHREREKASRTTGEKTH